MEKDKYVKITDNGHIYSTHNKAKEYGCTNYDYNGSLSNGTVCRVIATPYINNNCAGYALEYDNKHYLIDQSGTTESTKEEYEAQFEKSNSSFVKGLWYKVSDNQYMKFDYLAPIDNYNRLYITEEIFNGVHYFKKDYYASNSYEKHALEYPLEKVIDEIQPFLPEGHPDKVIKDSPKEPIYIAGRWYKMNNRWYSKCSNSSFNKEKFYGNESYNSDGGYDDYEFTTTLEDQNNSIVELTESMIDDKTPIELKTIICGSLKDGIVPDPKYEEGDELESCEGGWQYIETGLEAKRATSYASSDENIIKGKCTKVEWSNAHQIWWYKIGYYENMFTESGVKLVDELKENDINDIKEEDYSQKTLNLLKKQIGII